MNNDCGKYNDLDGLFAQLEERKVDHKLQSICYRQPLITITTDIDAISERDGCIMHGTHYFRLLYSNTSNVNSRFKMLTSLLKLYQNNLIIVKS